MESLYFSFGTVPELIRLYLIDPVFVKTVPP